VNDVYGLLHFAGGPYVWTLNVSSTSPKALWGYGIGAQTLSSPALKDDGSVFFLGGGDNAVWAFAAITGVLLWRTPTNGPCGTVLLFRT